MRHFILYFCLVLATICGLQQTAWAQPTKIGGNLDYSNPKEYTIADIVVTGVQYTDINTIKLFSGLQKGEKILIPGDEITTAIKNLWRQQLFADVSIYAAEFRGSDVFLVIDLVEMPRLAGVRYLNLKKSEIESIREVTDLVRGRIVNENLITTTKNRIMEYLIEKGYYNATITIESVPSSLENSVDLNVKVNKNGRVKIDAINFVFEGDTSAVNQRLLKRSMKETKEKRWWRVFKSSKLIEENYEDDKLNILARYNSKGYRNARILSDSIYSVGPNLMAIDMKISEGNQFYFGDITWSGNTKYRTGQLDSILKINKGDVYSAEELEIKLYQNPRGLDVTSLYSNDGYLNFQAIPVEVQILNDTIDLEVRMMEGKQYRIGKVKVTGNTKTNDRVVYREIRTRPGELFSRADILRTQRELANLGYFNPESFQVIPTQNQEDGTVDIEYIVEEKPSDQIELSGGWGGGRVVGTLGLSFTNFSMRNFFKKGAWRPVPSGDGQRLSIRAQTNGQFFQSYNISFTEPWLGGRKPNSLTVGMWHSIQSNGQRRTIDGVDNPLRQDLRISGVSVGLGQRWKRPDDWFLFYAGISYQHFDLNNFNSFFDFANGNSNNLALELSLQRNSVSDPIFPTWGSNIKFTTKLTLPYSRTFLRDQDFTAEDITAQEKFKWVEYHKWKFTAKWYTTLTKSNNEENQRRLVLHTHAGVGLLGFWNRDIGLSPFERFYLGGVFLSGFQLDGREIVNLRGYDDLSLTFPNPNTGSPVIAKYGMELRYPLSTNPSATIYALTFAEAGNTWSQINEFNPFQVNRSAGVGLRIFLPMFGLLGLDYGWRFDDIPQAPNMANGQFHFSIGMNLGEL